MNFQARQESFNCPSTVRHETGELAGTKVFSGASLRGQIVVAFGSKSRLKSGIDRLASLIPMQFAFSSSR